MKADQFKKLIRAIVQEEIKKTLPVLVPRIVAEALGGKQANSKLIEREEKSEDFFESLKRDMSGQIVKEPPKQQKKIFTNNSLLNAALNETQGGVPPDAGFGSQIQRPNFQQSTHPLNVKTPVSAEPILNEETKVQAEMGIYKDYRKLMKVVDVKKKQGAFGGGSIGGLSIDAGVPNDFKTID